MMYDYNKHTFDFQNVKDQGESLLKKMLLKTEQGKLRTKKKKEVLLYTEDNNLMKLLIPKRQVLTTNVSKF